jgi:hypothetical protein
LRPCPLPIPGQLARPAVGCPIAYRVCRIVATGPMSGHVGTWPPAPEGDGHTGGDRAGRGAPTPNAGDGPELAPDRLDSNGDCPRRGPPPSGVRHAEDIRVLRGSAAASCVAMSNIGCLPRKPDPSRYAAYHTMQRPATPDAEFRGRNSPGARMRHHGNRPIEIERGTQVASRCPTWRITTRRC